MTDPGQFKTNKPHAGNASSSPLDCAAVELLLAESAENVLPPAIAEQLRIHVVDCATCHEKLAQTRRGREWLLVLKQESLDPPADLVAKILARTSLAHTPGMPDTVVPAPALNRPRVLGFSIRDHARHQHDTEDIIPVHDAVSPHVHNSVAVLRRRLLEPRLALVAAMAFFSISLTMNLLGIRLTSLHATDLTPQGLHRAVTRQYADTNAHVVRYYENLRIVYEVEARVQQLRRAAETSVPEEQEARPRKQSSNPSWDSRSGRTNSSLRDWHTLTASFVLPFEAPSNLPPAPLVSSCPLPDVYFSMRERRLA